MEPTKNDDVHGLPTGLRRSSRLSQPTNRFDHTNYETKPSNTVASVTNMASSQEAEGKEAPGNPNKKAKQSASEKKDLLKQINEEIKITASLGTQGKTPEEVTRIVGLHDEKIEALCALVERDISSQLSFFCTSTIVVSSIVSPSASILYKTSSPAFMR